MDQGHVVRMREAYICMVTLGKKLGEMRAEFLEMPETLMERREWNF